MHSLDLSGNVAGALVLTCGVALVLVVEGNDGGTVDVGDGGATSSAGEHGDFGVGVVGNEHVLLVAEADAGGTSGGSLALSSLVGDVNLVDVDGHVVGFAHAFDGEVVGEELGEIGGEGPCGSIVTVDGDSGAHVLGENGVGVEVILVHDLVHVFIPG